MLVYPSAVKKQMIRFYCSLNERDRRRYAAIEALKLGSRGVNYISQVLKCDQKTIKKGRAYASYWNYGLSSVAPVSEETFIYPK